jgi:hypothetical protein
VSDLTLLHYTANRVSPTFWAETMTRARLAAGRSVPMVLVSQQPIAETWAHHPRDVFHCVGPIGASIYNVYRQVLIGAKLAQTPFVACVEDDSLYSPDHFWHRPPLDTFFYNDNRWVITRRLSDDGKSRTAFYYWRHRTQMAMCIAPRELLIATLEERFAKYPDPVPHDIAKATGWGEPGRYEKNIGITRQTLAYFNSKEPCVTFNHALGLMGRRAVKDDDRICTTLERWGDANDLWRTIHGA